MQTILSRCSTKKVRPVLPRGASLYSTWFEVPPSMTWLQTCQNLLSDLTCHVMHLNALITDCTNLQDQDSCLSLRYSNIISLTTLAQMGYALSRKPSWTMEPAMEARTQCAGVLRRILTIVATLETDKFRFLDPLSNVCASLYQVSPRLLTVIF